MGFLGHNKKFWYAVAVIVGSMVGVGIFGLPYAFVKAGFFVGMGLLVLIGLETLLIDTMYGEVVLRTHAKHQLIGYAKKYLGTFFQRLIFFAAVLTGYAALLAYIIISGDFLSTILSPFFYISPFACSVLFFIFVSLAVLRGLKTISWLELVFSSFFIAIIVLFFIAGVGDIQPAHYAGYAFDQSYLPYGVLLFAFGGMLAVPIAREVLVGQERKLRRAILYGVSIVAALYTLFTLTVVGISGVETSQDAISGLLNSIGPRVAFIGALFGITAVATCFMMIGTALSEIFNFDLKIHKSKAWLLAVVPPFLLFIGGFRAFVDVIGLAGGVALGLEHIMIIWLYVKAKRHGDRVPEYSLAIPNWILYIVMAILATGIGYYLILR